MAELTARQQQQIEDAIAEEMSADAGGRAQGLAASVIDPGQLKDLFCENWEKVKQALAFIARLPMVPQQLKDAIDRLIRIGDRIHGIICG
jgi:hypothetical protein